MWEQPHYRYTVATENQPGLVSTLPALETEVPGTLVYGLVRNSRLKKETRRLLSA